MSVHSTFAQRNKQTTQHLLLHLIGVHLEVLNQITSYSAFESICLVVLVVYSGFWSERENSSELVGQVKREKRKLTLIAGTVDPCAHPANSQSSLCRLSFVLVFLNIIEALLNHKNIRMLGAPIKRMDKERSIYKHLNTN